MSQDCIGEEKSNLRWVQNIREKCKKNIRKNIQNLFKNWRLYRGRKSPIWGGFTIFEKNVKKIFETIFETYLKIEDCIGGGKVQFEVGSKYSRKM